MRWYVDFIDRDSMWDTIGWVFVYDFAVMSKWTGSRSDFVTWLYVTGLSAILVAVLHLEFVYRQVIFMWFLCDMVIDLKDNVGIISDLATCTNVILFKFWNKINNFFQGKKK